MQATMKSRVSSMIHRIRHTWVEMDYAQRRLFELRTAIPTLSGVHTPPDRALIDELEAVYALQPRETDNEAT